MEMTDTHATDPLVDGEDESKMLSFRSPLATGEDLGLATGAEAALEQAVRELNGEEGPAPYGLDDLLIPECEDCCSCCNDRWVMGKTVQNINAAFTIWCRSILNLETAFACAIAAAATIVCWNLRNGKSERFSTNMSWSLVSVALVFPLVYSIGQAFRRREEALDQVADFKALLTNQFIAQISWDWSPAGLMPKAGWGGRKLMPPDFAALTHANMLAMIDTVEGYLKLPTVTRGRHRVTSSGRTLKTRVSVLQQWHVNNFTRCLFRFSRGIESLKARGMPGNEAARLNQYLWITQSRFERLRRVKEYRTPQAVRSFARVYILVLPIFYAPYYVYIAGDGNGANGTNLAFAVALSVLTSAVMMGLFNVEHALEDPFDDRGLDAIMLSKEMEDLRSTLSLIAARQLLIEAKPNSCAIMWGVDGCSHSTTSTAPHTVADAADGKAKADAAPLNAAGGQDATAAGMPASVPNSTAAGGAGSALLAKEVDAGPKASL